MAQKIEKIEEEKNPCVATCFSTHLLAMYINPKKQDFGYLFSHHQPIQPLSIVSDNTVCLHGKQNESGIFLMPNFVKKFFLKDLQVLQCLSFLSKLMFFCKFFYVLCFSPREQNNSSQTILFYQVEYYNNPLLLLILAVAYLIFEANSENLHFIPLLIAMIISTNKINL